MKYIFKYIFATFMTTVFMLSLVSCRDEDLLENFPEEDEMPVAEDLYTLNFSVTVDKMGLNSYSHSYDPEFITRNESYINLDRFRVLFFDADDMFLFESKNRWLKQIDDNDSFSSWYVSIPLGAFGNDTYDDGKDYNWDDIRKKLTTEKFKIAVMANRPANLLYPGFMESELELPDGVFDNDGPYWGPDDVGKRNIFELHHFQYDIIYADKGKHSGGAANSYYDFVMGDINTDRPTMGAAVNWVSFDNGDTDKETITSSVAARNCIMAGKEHPIPMYGVQIFDPIPADKWEIGTPFDISNEPVDAYPDPEGLVYNHNSISLLRSCVRIDLLIPKTVKNGAKPTFLTLWYSNIYSRTEPMNNWTPTDELWNRNGAPHSDTNCEMDALLNYGPVSWASAPYYSNSKDAYQKRLSWYYGAWKGRWDFKTRSNTYVTPVAETSSTPYPQIFNPCIQRNKVIRFNNNDVTNYYNDGYHHYVIYTGERNINDPNTLPDLTKNPYIASIVISWDKANYYAIPLLDFSKNTELAGEANVWGPHTSSPYSTGSWPSALEDYMKTVPNETNKANYPLPLLRNHIYRYILKGTKGSDDPDDLFITSEVAKTENINFSEKVKKMRPPVLPKRFKSKKK